jgi:hypothetical protein
MNYTVLKSELDSGSYSVDPQLAAEELNAVTETVNGLAESGLIRGYLAKIGKLFEINEASKDPNSPVKDIACAVVMTLQPGGTIDFASAGNQAMLDVVVTALGLTEEDKNAILSFGQRQVSKAESLGLGKVRACDIERARAL